MLAKEDERRGEDHDGDIRGKFRQHETEGGRLEYGCGKDGGKIPDSDADRDDAGDDDAQKNGGFFEYRTAGDGQNDDQGNGQKRHARIDVQARFQPRLRRGLSRKLQPDERDRGTHDRRGDNFVDDVHGLFVRRIADLTDGGKEQQKPARADIRPHDVRHDFLLRTSVGLEHGGDVGGYADEGETRPEVSRQSSSRVDELKESRDARKEQDGSDVEEGEAHARVDHQRH